jgi:ankyrin repeat protein
MWSSSTRGLDVNVKNSNGEAPLHHAALGGHDEVTNLLLNHGADINTKSRFDARLVRSRW